ncbi:MAG: hypothetical protein GJ677_14970 [Rhodobacteraceae bacterium]|nr:hypothetical protein [Paracoccaceae bacterium]
MVDVDVNNMARDIVIAGISETPEVGGVLGGLLGLLWPESEEDVWGQIRKKVEKLIDKKIADTVFRETTESLNGLERVLQDYVDEIGVDDPTQSLIGDKFASALSQFEDSADSFMAEGYEILLLPLFAQMANMHLSLLRDAVCFGKDWGWNDKEVEDHHRYLVKAIRTYESHANKWFDEAIKPMPFMSEMIIFKEVNKKARELTLSVMDFAHYWSYFDPDNTPRGKVPPPQREIYADFLGTTDASNFKYESRHDSKITGVHIWGGEQIDVIQVKYGDTWGPKMGHVGGGTDKPPKGLNLTVSEDKPLYQITGAAGDVLDSIQLHFIETDEDGNESFSKSNRCGGSGGDEYNFYYKDHIVSSLKVMGVSSHYGCGDSLLIGFRYKDSYG